MMYLAMEETSCNGLIWNICHGENLQTFPQASGWGFLLTTLFTKWIRNLLVVERVITINAKQLGNIFLLTPISGVISPYTYKYFLDCHFASGLLQSVFVFLILEIFFSCVVHALKVFFWWGCYICYIVMLQKLSKLLGKSGRNIIHFQM